MIVPDKFTRYRESVLSLLPDFDAAVGDGAQLLDVLKRVERQIDSDLWTFMMGMDALFVLGRIELDEEGGVRRVG